MHLSDDLLQLALVGDGLLEPVILLLGQGDRHGLGVDFAGPDIPAALLAGPAFKDAALAEAAQLGELSPELAVRRRRVRAGFHRDIEAKKLRPVNLVSI